MASHLVGGYRMWSGIQRDRLRHASFALDTPQMIRTTFNPFWIGRRPGYQWSRRCASGRWCTVFLLCDEQSNLNVK
ncbi:hypothetical protein DPMN_174686 [Dreissena polymorpha]|uniref:Uncharacterized protein n=1 Tax=Dreissena polymorpha TaxID=45954 RepID=A0A9D4E7Y0_DREPO|nr:hypothetical protein DPMN_174686 [Dreissena polymorpha]